MDTDHPGVAIKHRGKFKTLSASEHKLPKRRQAIEPIIGHLKQVHRNAGDAAGAGCRGGDQDTLKAARGLALKLP